MKKEELNYYDCFIKNVELALRMTTILKQYVEKMMNKLKTSKKYELVVIINKLEGEGDKIFQCAEQVCDSCESLALLVRL